MFCNFFHILTLIFSVHGSTCQKSSSETQVLKPSNNIHKFFHSVKPIFSANFLYRLRSSEWKQETKNKEVFKVLSKLNLDSLTFLESFQRKSLSPATHSNFCLPVLRYLIIYTFCFLLSFKLSRKLRMG